MAVPAYMWLLDDQGNTIKSTSHVKGRENAAEIYGLKHRIYIPTDIDTGVLMSTRKHEPYTILKSYCSASPVLYKACTSGKNLQEIRVSWYRINNNGHEEEYFRHILTNAKVVAIEPAMENIKDKTTENYGHMEQVSFRYQKIQWHYLDGNIATEDQWTER